MKIAFNLFLKKEKKKSLALQNTMRHILTYYTKYVRKINVIFATQGKIMA